MSLARANRFKTVSLGQPRQDIKRTRHSHRSTTAASYIGVFLFVVTIVALGYKSPKQNTAADSVANASAVPAVVSSQDTIVTASVDELVATRIAAGIAERAELPIARNIAEEAISLSVKNELAQIDNDVISKPQIIQPTASDREIRSYTTVAGDTVDTLAAQFNVSADTIKWANNLTSSALESGKELQIPRVNGVIYTVREGDTTGSIAQKYRADEKRVILYNDLDLGGLEPGKKLIIPDGDLPTTERPGYTAPVRAQIVYSVTRYGAGFAGSRTWTIGYGTAANKYAYGNCTAYAYNRRVQLGKGVGAFWGNAATWAARAQAEGYLVNNVPSVGAIMQNGGGYGHVAIVEEILPNGDISVSEMNAYVPGGGFNVVSGRIVPAANVGSYSYIH